MYRAVRVIGSISEGTDLNGSERPEGKSEAVGGSFQAGVRTEEAHPKGCGESAKLAEADGVLILDPRKHPYPWVMLS